MTTSSRIVGVAGTFASGKDTVCDYLHDRRGFYSEVTSDIIRAEAKKRRGSIDRPILVEVGNELRAERGAGCLSEIILDNYEGVKDKFPNGVVIGGIRAIGEAEAVKKRGGIMVFVDAPVKIRYERLKKRGRLGDEETLESFRKSEQLELRGQTSKVGQNIMGVKKMADHVIQNDSDLEAFYRAIDKVLDLK